MLVIGFGLNQGLRQQAADQLERLQRAADEQCGAGAIVVDWDSFFTQIPHGPGYGWDNSNASCEGDEITGTIKCICP
jgi:hypothetical protein